MSCSDNDKAQGLIHLSKSDWPSLPTLFVLGKQELSELDSFCKQYQTVTCWILRSLQPVPMRYEAGNHLVSTLNLQSQFLRQPWMLEACIPFCLQPYVSAVAAGVFLIKENQILAEFVSGSSGGFLRGLTNPFRCLARIEDNRQVVIIEIDAHRTIPSQDLLNQVTNAALAIPDSELLDRRKKLVEWVTTSEREVFFVDYQLMGDDFIPKISPINTNVKIIYPGSLDFPIFDIKTPLFSLPNSCIIATEMPHLEIIPICRQRNIRGLLIKGGSFLSHVSRFAGEKGIPCRFGQAK